MWVGRSKAFEVEGGALLHVRPGQIAASFRLRRNPDPTEEGEPIDTASCLVRLADAVGEIWEAESTFSLHVFIENMVNLDRTSWLIYFDDSEEWKAAFEDDCLMTGATCLLDDRFYRRLLVGDDRVELQFKYQSPSFDVAFYRSPHVPDLTSLLVRVSGLYDSDMNEIRPLVFEMDWRHLLFRNELYFDAEAGDWTGDRWPLPLIFRRVGSTGFPQSLVTYEAGPGSQSGVG